MPWGADVDAVVIGSGPNGLAAAITLARHGLQVVVVEGRSTVGGGLRTAELTLPGFRHDVCAAIHPLGVASPFFRSLDLESNGVRWIHPEFPMVQPLDDGRAIVQEREVSATAERLGVDRDAYEALLGPLTRLAPQLYADLLGPLAIPRHPLAMLRFGMKALFSADQLARMSFRTAEARALLAGHGAHSILPLDTPGTAAFALMLALSAHAVGWPVARGGSQAIADALTKILQGLGGRIVCDLPVRDLGQLPPARAYLFDTAPKAMSEICGDRLPGRYRAGLRRFRHGPGVCKVDWALAGPIPWTHEAARRTACLHIGASFPEIAESERMAWNGEQSARPFLIVAQPSVIDASRAPVGQHTGWGYAHVPHGSSESALERIESQIERFAPGFRELILARHVMHPAEMEAYNPNYVGGDIAGGVQDLGQLYARPVPRWDPYSSPAPDLFICSASTPPGGGVHGMCGYHAARSVLRRRFGIKAKPLP